ncbi:MAG: hypothetical protein SZ59_C0002G0153 [candidate division TM6 bacterium GW2011_GWF2_28_16]|nr:MAG: hypothetical protein SZ59_C0002G0153 [candidate division TM6 bacterium GW2011_GWF2_28_16]
MNKNILLILLALAVTNICSAFNIIIKNNTKKDWNVSLVYPPNLFKDNKGGQFVEVNIKKGTNKKINNLCKILSIPNEDKMPKILLALTRLIKKANNVNFKNLMGRELYCNLNKLDANIEATKITQGKNYTPTVVINEIKTSDPEYAKMISSRPSLDPDTTLPYDGVVYYFDVN